MGIDYSSITEIANEGAPRHQLEILYARYLLARRHSDQKDVLEVACGSGQGLGFLKSKARLVVGGDYTENLLQVANVHYRNGMPLLRLDAHDLPFADHSFDVILLYEAIYYLAQPARFLAECRRVLRFGGRLLISTVNCEWADFNPSPFSTTYFSGRGLFDLLENQGFRVELFGGFPDQKKGLKSKLLSFIKRTAVSFHIIPKTMKGKGLLKRIFYGPLTPIPAEITEGMAEFTEPARLSPNDPLSSYKFIYAVAHL